MATNTKKSTAGKDLPKPKSKSKSTKDPDVKDNDSLSKLSKEKMKEKGGSTAEEERGVDDKEAEKKSRKSKKPDVDMEVSEKVDEVPKRKEKKDKAKKGEEIDPHEKEASEERSSNGKRKSTGDKIRKTKSQKGENGVAGNEDRDTAQNHSTAVKLSEKAKRFAKETILEPSDEESSAEASGSEDDGHLYGFSTDDEDSSDDEDDMDYTPEDVDVGKLPTIAKDDAAVKKRLEKAKRQPKEDKGVIFISRLPHGFFEDQLRGYFSQFGDVTRLRLSRNKKTGRSKHYAFIEFDSSSVAKIVAETMDNYLIMGHILRCKVIPNKEVHPELWVGANKKWKKVPGDRLERLKHDKPRTEQEMIKAESRLIKRQNQKKRKLEEAGIKYDFDAVAYKKKSNPAKP